MAVVHPVTIRPLVVARRKDERPLEGLVQAEPVLDETVVAPLAARFDISRMHHEIDVVVAIDFGDKSGERRFFDRAVRHVADQGKRERCHAASPSPAYAERIAASTRRLTRDNSTTMLTNLDSHDDSSDVATEAFATVLAGPDVAVKKR